MDAVSHRAEMIDSTAWGIGFDWNELIELANYMEDKEVRQGEILFNKENVANEVLKCPIVVR